MTDINAPFRAALAKRDYRSVHIASDSRAPAGMISPPRRTLVGRVLSGLLG